MSNSKFGFRTRNGLVKDYTIGLGVYDPDAQLFINNVGITDTTQKEALNKLVLDLKSYGIWSKMKVIYPFIGGTATTHKYNLKNPQDTDAAYRLLFNGGWTHTTSGAQGNGTNTNASTYFYPLTNLSTSSAHLCAYVNNGTTLRYPILLSAMWGSYTYNGLLLTNASNFNNFAGSIATTAYGELSSTPNPSEASFYMVNRQNALAQKLIKNNLILLTDAKNGVSYQPSVNLSIGLNDSRFTFASVGDGLTDTESVNLYTAIQVYNATLGREVGGKFVSDPDAQSFVFAAMISNQTQANIINQLVTDLKNANLWNKLKAIYPFIGGLASSHKFNLKDPRDTDAAYRLSFIGGWTHSINGATPNGTNAYADTFYIPSVSGLLDSAHISYYSRTNLNTNAIYLGSNDASNRHYIGEPTVSAALNSTSEGNYTPGSRAGHHLIKRENSTQTKQFYNGVVNTTSLINSTGLPNFKIYIGARNAAGTANNFTTNQVAFATIGDGLTDAESLSLYNIIQTYQIALSRAV